MCTTKKIVPKKLIYENYMQLEQIFNDKDDLNHEI